MPEARGLSHTPWLEFYFRRWPSSQLFPSVFIYAQQLRRSEFGVNLGFPTTGQNDVNVFSSKWGELAL